MEMERLAATRNIKSPSFNSLLESLRASVNADVATFFGIQTAGDKTFYSGVHSVGLVLSSSS